MRNILNVNNYHYRRGGSDVLYLEHAKIFEQLGWKSSYFAMQHPENESSPWSRFFVNELEFGNEYTLSQKVGMAAKVVYSFEAKSKLRALLREFPADVAHLHCIYHHLSPSILPTLREAGIPVVLTAHDLKLACPAYKMMNSQGICERCKTGSFLNVVRHRCIKGSVAASTVVAVESIFHRFMGTYKKNINIVVAPSQFIAQKLIDWGWPVDRIVYIPNYVDKDNFVPGFGKGKYLLYFGRMIRDKGVATLIQAAHMAGVPLRLAGTGPDEEDFRRLASSLGGDTVFLGYQNGERLHELIRGARAVVLPSEIYENAPMSVLESFALGTPAIGADIGGIPEIIEQSKTGWLFPSGHVSALSEVLRSVQDTENAVLKAMGQQARSVVELRYSRQGYLDSMLGLYSSLGVRF